MGPKPRKNRGRAGPRRGGPEGRGPERQGAQNFALFFLSRSHFRSFCVSLGVFSWNFGGVFEGRGPEMCTFGVRAHLTIIILLE